MPDCKLLHCVCSGMHVALMRKVVAVSGQCCRFLVVQRKIVLFLQSVNVAYFTCLPHARMLAVTFGLIVINKIHEKFVWKCTLCLFSVLRVAPSELWCTMCHIPVSPLFFIPDVGTVTLEPIVLPSSCFLILHSFIWLIDMIFQFLENLNNYKLICVLHLDIDKLIKL